MEEVTGMLGDAGFGHIEPLTRAAAGEFFKGRTDGLTTPESSRALAAIV